jgi:ABC-type nickel/cobalt efflux system permease component RcnA
MSLIRRRGRRALAVLLPLGCAVAAVLAADALIHSLAAQSPFGVSKAPAAAPPASGLVGWLLQQQAEFFRAISGAIRAAKQDGSAVWTLLGISFAYGVFHAAGPGHGKAVISSYLVASEETARRGILLAFVSALLQALVAIAIVGVGAWLLNATAQSLCSAERVVEIASYGLIAAFGARLLWIKGRGFWRAARQASAGSGLLAAELVPAGAGAASPPLHHHHDDHHHHGHHHDHGHDHAHHHGHAHAHAHAHVAHGQPGHVHDAHCGHSHGPMPEDLAGPGGLQRGLGAVVAAGIRPCSGAILVLVFALAQGLFWAGVASALVMGLGTALTVATIAVISVSAKGVARRLGSASARGALVLRGLETLAAGLVLLFGVGLLLGYVAAERVTCF